MSPCNGERQERQEATGSLRRRRGNRGIGAGVFQRRLSELRAAGRLRYAVEAEGSGELSTRRRRECPRFGRHAVRRTAVQRRVVKVKGAPLNLGTGRTVTSTAAAAGRVGGQKAGHMQVEIDFQVSSLHSTVVVYLEYTVYRGQRMAAIKKIPSPSGL